MDPVVKQQAAERIRTANDILVTVSANPSVDQLSAAIGMTLLLNKLGKHATAIFSGTVPSTLEFLQPEKTIEHNIDNLRDFIISLDKAKADKLRYKVEDDVVRIYITPYKSSLSEKDLSFTQGDYNVEVVIALGVQNRTQVDAALSAHGRILHDATIVAVTAGQGKPSDIGQINWQDPSASSLCEMMVSVSESFGSGLIDAQMATAFLTGIVAETERFRNNKTTPKVMTMSAQLMAAGANQQLIASKLALPDTQTPSRPAQPAPGPNEGTIRLDHQKLRPAAAVPAAKLAEQPAGAPKETPQADVKLDNDQIKIDAEGNVSPATGKFIPAPADFAPPNSASTVIPPVGGASAPLPDDIPLPGEHTLLNPASHQPSFGSSFSADTQPGWTGGSSPAFSATTDGEEKRQNSDIEQARAAVEQASAGVPPAVSASEAIAQPSGAVAQPSTVDSPAPPPLPPPLPESVISQAKK